MSAKQSLESGVKFPYDHREPRDAAHRTALGVIADLTDRRGIKWGFNEVDDDVRVEIVESLAAIIRLGMQP